MIIYNEVLKINEKKSKKNAPWGVLKVFGGRKGREEGVVAKATDNKGNAQVAPGPVAPPLDAPRRPNWALCRNRTNDE